MKSKKEAVLQARPKAKNPWIDAWHRLLPLVPWQPVARFGMWAVH